NVISGNNMAGVHILGASSTFIQGNAIGKDGGVVVAIPNGGDGVLVEAETLGIWPRHTVIGGRGGLGNDISHNGKSGINIQDGTGVLVRGNTISGNASYGVRLRGDQNVVGGPSPEEGNVIAFNGRSGVYVYASSGNLIGGATEESGTFIFGNQENGILISGLTGENNRIEGCNIGRTVGGGPSGNLQNGVRISMSSNNIVGGTEPHKANVIVANREGGVAIVGELTQGNRVQGNGIGVSLEIVNKGTYSNSLGILIDGAKNNVIGGSEPGARNLISGNDGDGILLRNNAANNRIEGNLIGLFADGINARGNGGAGIEILDSPNNLIGGAMPGARNVIADNGDGIFILGGALSANNVIQGNYIGTDVSGALDRGNRVNGVFAQAAELVVGGTEPGAGNLISANTLRGVFLSSFDSTHCRVQGNRIGTNATGMAALGNGGDGVLLESAIQCAIGGSAPGMGNLISGNGGNGVWLVTGATGNVVAGNFIGTNVTGNSSLGNGQSAVLIEDAQLNRIGGAQSGAANILSGTNQYGVHINHPLAKENRIEGNFIGTDITGSLPLGNRFGGVLIVDASDNYIGGTTPGAGNLISGNGGSGIRLFKTMNTPGRTFIQGNRIGTDVTGVLPLGNMSRGIDLSATVGVEIGGITEGARNLISGNGFSGILFHDEARESLVQGNFIGTDLTGLLPVPNGLDGVFIENAPSNLVGGATPGAGNLISGNARYGVYLLDSKAVGNRVQGNRIGTDLTGSSDIGNASAGMYIKAATGNALGGTGAGEGNQIAFNLAGVTILSGSMNPILSNSIFSNDGLGIDLGEDGVTANDEIDSDTGANDFQNYPILTDARIAEAQPDNILSITGTLHSATATEFLLQFFASEICDASGFGEGGTLIGSATVVTDVSGDAAFSFDFPVQLTGARQLTSTATDPIGNSSEFSQCLEVVGLPTPTPTASATFTLTSTPSPTASPSDTATQTPSASPTQSSSPSATFTGQPTVTASATPSATATGQPTSTPTATSSSAPSATPSPTTTGSLPATSTPTPTTTGSQAATPTATSTCAPDYNLDGLGAIDARDLLQLLAAIRSGDPQADFNCDGAVDGDDLLEFSGRWKE
ncbi:MAG: right-handed parallel beta-helix repeat-containing protein, partial [Candidatus Omnitrophica bacterium]|nr:right-handed parallel beta-helix repeat-containing protein [Candidatus Omnitrophota bacterium]